VVVLQRGDGHDGRVFRTRSGESVRPAAVRDEAVTRAAAPAPSADVARRWGSAR